MMNWRTLLKTEKIKIFIFFLLLIAAACTEKTEKTDYIVKVNDSYLTAEELYALIDSTKGTKAERQEAIKNWITKELLYQQAEKEGIISEQNYRRLVQQQKKELAAALLLKKLSSEYKFDIKQQELENYYNQFNNDFKLTSRAFLLNIISFNNRGTAVDFRNKVIQSGWEPAANQFKNDSSLISISSNQLLAEEDIYPVKVARAVKALDPPEISIVINIDAEYYTVAQVLKKFSKNSVPPLKIIKHQVKERYIAFKTQQMIDNYINDLYKNSQIEIKN